MRPNCDKSVTTSPQPQPPNMSPVTVAPCSPQIGKGPLNLCLNPIIDFEDLMPTDRLCDTNTTRHARFLGWWSFQLGEHWWQQAACWSPAFKSSQQQGQDRRVRAELHVCGIQTKSRLLKTRHCSTFGREAGCHACQLSP